MHQSLSNQYHNCNCSNCNSYRLKFENDNLFKSILKQAKKSFKTLFENSSYNPKDSTKIGDYQLLTQLTANVLQKGIPQDVPQELKNYLEKDIFIFSGLKTHAQLTEARSFLKDEKGNPRSYEEFERLVTKLNETYNKNYLEAEYLFAMSSAQSAANWNQFSNDTSRYYLQYRTAGDNRVRDSHRALHNITLPKDDAFWEYYYIPNGWRCRCQVIEVLASKSTKSNSAESISKGEKAVRQITKNGNNTNLFKFNPGQLKIVYPPNNAYTKVVGADVVKTNLKSKPAFTPKGIDNYAKKLNIEINYSFFDYLTKETGFTTKKTSLSKGAYYNPSENYVKIPIDDRRKNSKWYAQAIVYHEFGHAADFHNDFRKLSIVKDLMNKYRNAFSQNDDKLYKQIDNKLRTLYFKAAAEKDNNLIEKVGAAADTLMSLNTSFGVGHPVSYFQQPGLAEAEFLAHTFENKFAGNEIFKQVMPDLYEDMIQLAEALKTKLKQHHQ